MKRYFYLMLMLSAGFLACQSSRLILTVGPEKKDCMGEAPQQCLLIKEGDQTEWEFLYEGIEGFEYKEGFEYRLEVKKEVIKNPPQDGSSLKYVLIRELSRGPR